MVRDERGSATPLLALLVVAVGGLCLGVGHLGGLATTRAAAQTAADAAALAGVVDGEEAAAALAGANGGELVGFDDDDGEVQVEVRLGDARAWARATGGDRALGGEAADGLAPALVDALEAAGRLLGRRVPVTSGWRSRAEQQRLYDDRATNRYPVARPGTSMHERGRAVDIPRWFVARLASVSTQVGICHPWPATDPVHFELCRRNK